MDKEEALKEFLKGLRVALKTVLIYHPEHAAVIRAVEELKKKEPIAMFEKKLLEQGVLTQEDFVQIAAAAKEEALEAEKFAKGSPIQEDASILDRYLYAD